LIVERYLEPVDRVVFPGFALIRLSKLKDVVSDVAGKELTDLFFM
jgi:hypothetical protein